MSGNDLVVSESVEEIQQLSAVQDSAYWEGPRCGALQKKYAEYLAARDGVPSPTSDAAPSAHAVVNKIYDALQEEYRWPLYDAVSRLPAVTQQAIEYALGFPPPAVGNVTPEQMISESCSVGDAIAHFTSWPLGARFVEEWGEETNRMVTKFFVRMGYIATLFNDPNVNVATNTEITRWSDGQQATIITALTR